MILRPALLDNELGTGLVARLREVKNGGSVVVVVVAVVIVDVDVEEPSPEPPLSMLAENEGLGDGIEMGNDPPLNILEVGGGVDRLVEAAAL